MYTFMLVGEEGRWSEYKSQIIFKCNELWGRWGRA